MDMKIEKKELVALKGFWIATLADCRDMAARKWCREIERLRDRGENVGAMIREFNVRYGIKEFRYQNLIPTVGRTLIANNLTDSTPDDDPYANYVAVGTGTNVPANGDTQLQTEHTRTTTASASNSNNIGYITGFYGYTQANATLREAGIFCNGTATANSGKLLSRVAMNVTKAATNTLTLDWTITIS